MALRAAIESHDTEALRNLLSGALRRQLNNAFAIASRMGYAHMVDICCTAALHNEIELTKRCWFYMKLAISRGHIKVCSVLKEFLTKNHIISVESQTEHVIRCICFATMRQQDNIAAYFMEWLRQLKRPRITSNGRAYALLENAARFNVVELVGFMIMDMQLASTVELSKALVTAVDERSWAVVDLLVDFHCVDFSIDRNYVIRRLVRAGHVKLLQRVLERSCWDHTIDPAVDDNTLVIAAAGSGRLDILRLLCESPRVNPSARNNTAIMDAVKGNHNDVIQYLVSLPIERGVDVNVNKGLVPWIAIGNKSIEIVRTLLTCPHFDLAAHGTELAAFACRSGFTEALELLLACPEVDFECVMQRAHGWFNYTYDLMEDENDARHGRVHQDLANALTELTPLPRGPASLVYQFVHNSVDPRVQASFAPKIYDAMRN